MSISDSLTLMFAFATFIVMLLGLIIEIIKNTKKIDPLILLAK